MITRRAAMASTLALAACGQSAQSQTQPPGRPLREAPFPIGAAIMTGHIQNEGFLALVRRHISQLTPEWEMKMEYILQPDGSLKFDAPDAIVNFARAENLKVHGHTLIWYAQGGGQFEALKNDKSRFEQAYADYIKAVVSRYAGPTRSWDVVNEPVTDEGTELRTCLWTEALGEIDHAVKAFQYAAEADPNAILFLNEYHLELKPTKRRTFLKMAETLLERGVKLGGIGTQTHVDIDLPPGAIKTAMREIAQLGLPVHLSELDISTHMKSVDLRSGSERLRLQAQVAEEAAEAFMALPPAQRFGFSLWGLRDSDSWLHGPSGTSKDDRPSLFDETGAEKPAFAAIEKVLLG